VVSLGCRDRCHRRGVTPAAGTGAAPVSPRSLPDPSPQPCSPRRGLGTGSGGSLRAPRGLGVPSRPARVPRRRPSRPRLRRVVLRKSFSEKMGLISAEQWVWGGREGRSSRVRPRLLEAQLPPAASVATEARGEPRAGTLPALPPESEPSPALRGAKDGTQPRGSLPLSSTELRLSGCAGREHRTPALTSGWRGKGAISSLKNQDFYALAFS